MSRRGLPPGISRKHSRRCPAHRENRGEQGRCRGDCPFQVQAGPRAARLTRTVATLDEAVAWKADVEDAKRQGKLAKGRAPTLREAAAKWEADARAGVALARGDRRFKAGTIADYVTLLNSELLPAHGDERLDRLGDRLDELVMGFQRRGLAASTVRNKVMPLRAVYRHAVRMKWIASNPTVGLQVPSGSGKRVRVVEAPVIVALLAALDARDRALWATAFYAGLRRGELQALTWADVDMAAGMIGVRGSYDQKTRTMGAPKSEAGERRVPVNGALRDFLLEHRARAGARPQGLVFARGSLAADRAKGNARDPGLPFNDSSTGARAARAWARAGLAPVTLHEARHTFASLVIAAMSARGVFNPKLLQRIMGHSSMTVTFDRYGHLFPGQEAEVAVMLDEFLDTDAASLAVAQAWSRLQDAVEGSDPGVARLVVSEAVAWLMSWQEARPERGLLPSGARGVQEACGRAVTVQRDPGIRGSR